MILLFIIYVVFLIIKQKISVSELKNEKFTNFLSSMMGVISVISLFVLTYFNNESKFFTKQNLSNQI